MAQWIEHRIPVPRVGGSSPFRCTTKRPDLSIGRTRPFSMKCALRAWVDLFHFTFHPDGKFHNDQRSLLHFRRIFYFLPFLLYNIVSPSAIHQRIPLNSKKRGSNMDTDLRAGVVFSPKRTLVRVPGKEQEKTHGTVVSFAENTGWSKLYRGRDERFAGRIYNLPRPGHPSAGALQQAPAEPNGR